MFDIARFDVILSDVMMKPMDRIEFLHTLRNAPSLRLDAAKAATPFVFLTSCMDKKNHP